MRRKSTIQKKIWLLQKLISESEESCERGVRIGELMALQWALGACFNYHGEVIDGEASGVVQPKVCRLLQDD